MLLKHLNTTHPDYDRLLPKWQRCSDTVDGQDAVRAKRDGAQPEFIGWEHFP